ncbi:asparagine synthase (glutamine-hydrolyzing) [Cecembia calidifontis]|uniref:asparagine synthase (glutamine-hydrolyzing) n=1 Tax=Cecembia calidifontis TaxID=1187080 RepID=A0A4Q7PDL7_9BACT|nr:asparagine synthase (glutamine-hydrolyzing) [Cecembia calidifontis]RZS98461.1 asparagine synthase (glutamine-hydrolysing) [Cecembia calidifontis]
MCGIAGFIDFKSNTSKETLHQMVNSMQHRGPDDSGGELFEEKNALIGFGQARLSIIDLSSAGHQPMHFKHLSIVFNGEIYNYKEIKSELQGKGRGFITQTDTEVILQSFDEWGLKCVDRFIGMFAFVIYDRKNNKIVAFRDRAGVKPFYYYYLNNLLLFGSELKALMTHSKFEKVIDEAVLPNYFHYGYIAAPHTIFKHTCKLMPGHYLEVDLATQKVNITKYWDLRSYYLKPKLNLDYQEIKEEVKALMQSSFDYRMVADVPVGVFLSGGYDSTAVTALLQSKSSRALKTFTIGFEEGNNEAPYAKETAQFLGTDHTEYLCSTKEAQEIIPTLPFFFDEPFGDSSGIPTILVSKLAKQQVTVALSADAGDEIFGGYLSYFKLNSFLKKIEKLPSPLKSTWTKKLASFTMNNDLVNCSKFTHQLGSVLDVLNQDEYSQAADLFRYMSEKPKGYVDKLFKIKCNTYPSSFIIDANGFQNPLEVAMCIDFNSYLPNDILTKVDRATMSVSLEGREPLLDHRLAAYAAQIPLEYKIDGVSGKKILKDIVHDYVPKAMMDRPKTGFSLPIYSWLRGDLSYLVDEYLSEEALNASGLFNVTFLLKEVEKFKQNKLHYSPVIWYLLMFQMWYKKWAL